MRSLVATLCAALLLGQAAQARDQGQWADADPAVSEWFATLKQPDNPNVSCCGEADAYWADDIHVEVVGDVSKVIAVITDDRDDEPLHRPHVPIGTRIEVPPHKLKWDRGNPVGHSIIFLSRNLDVYCFVQAGGT